MSLRRRITLLGLLNALLIVTGCGRNQESLTEPVEPFRGQSITLGAVGDPVILETAALQVGEWEQTRGGQIAIQKSAIEPAKESALEGIDVVIFPGDRLGDLVDFEALLTIPDNLVRPAQRSGDDRETSDESIETAPAPDPLNFEEILPVYREQVTLQGDQRIGFPYGGSALVLVYRQEALEAPGELPGTWKQLDALLQKLQGTDWNGNGSPGAGIAIPLGEDPEGVGLSIFLARAAALGMHPDFYSFFFDTDSMQPRIDSPPFVEALQALLAWKAFGPPGMENFDIEAARQAFQAGEVAFLIDRAERVHQWVKREDARKVGVAPLPGSERIYNPSRKVWEDLETPNRVSYLPKGGGWLVGVSKRSEHREAALDFARFLVESETASRVRSDLAFPMVPVRGALIGQGPPDPRSIPTVDLLAWSEAVSKTLMAPKVVLSLRIPEALGYLNNLDQARVAAMSGEDVETVLESAVETWNKRTDRLGRERQLWQYRRSLNALATSSEPPPRNRNPNRNPTESVR